MFNRAQLHIIVLVTMFLSTIASAGVSPYPGTPEELLEKGKAVVKNIREIVPKETLPGKKIPYISRSDRGDRYLVSGTIVNYMAHAADSGDMFELATITGGKESGQPLHKHKDHFVALFLMDGEAELWLDGKKFLMKKGDFANIPSNIYYGFKFNRHRSKMLAWYSGTGIAETYKVLGTPTDLHIQPEFADVSWEFDRMHKSEHAGDIIFSETQFPKGKLKEITRKLPPEGIVPFTIAADEGIKYTAGPEFYSILTSQSNTGGRFFVVMTQGPETRMIPKHYHNENTENFFCLDGEMNMIVNNSKAVLKPGDYAAVPTGTTHAYQMTQPFNRFIGFLTPSLFQNFFETLGNPGYEGNVYPSKEHAFHFGKVMKELGNLDLILIDKPGKPGKQHKH